MTGTKKITLLALAGVVLLFGIYNWWSYFRTEGVSMSGAKSVSTEAPVSPAHANASMTTTDAASMAKPVKREDGGVSEMEEEPPKRPPLEGSLLYNPFYRDRPATQGPKEFKGMTHAVNVGKVPPAEDEDYRLELVLMDGGRQLAMVNERLYATGDRLGSMDIVRIEPGRIVLEDGLRKTHILSLTSDNGS